MNYRELGNTGLMVSEIGFGGEYLEGKEYPLVERTLTAALDAGMNLIDVFMSEPRVRANIGRAILDRREQVMIQGHFRSVWRDGQYGRTLELDETKAAFDDLLYHMGGYVDIGMLHMVDNDADYEAVMNGPIYEYALACRRAGKVRLLGMSSHNPELALRAVRDEKIQVLLFSLNPAYDLLAPGPEDGPPALAPDLFTQGGDRGMVPVRAELYRACAAAGVGITVMKSLAAGVLLDERRSPFGTAMTVPQCIHYALSRPAVSSVLVGMQRPEEVDGALAYERLDDTDRDYAPVLTSRPRFTLDGKCMYCNHCLPCPAQINIARVNQYLDLAESEGRPSPTLLAHYGDLGPTAAACIHCGACESRCPFGVPVQSRMERAVQVFGR